MSYALSRTPFVPPSEAQRVGDTLVLDMLYYDTLLYGIGQDLAAENQLFTSATRIRNDNLCNLKEIGRFSDGKQFAAYCLSVQFWHDTVPAQYEIFTYQSRIHVKYKDAERQIIWCDQAGAGGGVYGFDNNANAFHLTNGIPSRGNCWMFSDPLIIVPNKTFELTHKFMTGLVGGAADPLTTINADEAGNRLLRFYLRGIEGRDATS